MLCVDAQKYRSVAEIRGAFVGQRRKLLPQANARILQRRRDLDLSQADMAARHGVSKSFWQQMELGKKSVPAAILQAMGDA
jgi:DNA-binding XRE family transcriptional regulator